MRKIEIAVPTASDIREVGKVARLSFAAQIQKLGKSLEPTTAEQKAKRKADKIAAKRAKLEAAMRELDDVAGK